MVEIWYSLYDRMLNRDNLVKAFFKVKSAKGAAGIDGRSIGRETFYESINPA